MVLEILILKILDIIKEFKMCSIKEKLQYQGRNYWMNDSRNIILKNLNVRNVYLKSGIAEREN